MHNKYIMSSGRFARGILFRTVSVTIARFIAGVTIARFIAGLMTLTLCALQLDNNRRPFFLMRGGLYFYLKGLPAIFFFG